MFLKLFLYLLAPISFSFIVYYIHPQLPGYAILDNEDLRFDFHVENDAGKFVFPIFELAENNGFGEFFPLVHSFYKLWIKLRFGLNEDDENCSSENTDFGGVRVRMYFPRTNPVVSPSSKAALRPAILYIHGGGWCIFDIEAHDHPVRTLAKTLGLVTVSVDYRRAPAHPHPAQLDDVTTALRYLVTHAHQWGIDPERILVAGDSAGGQLTLTLSLRWRRLLKEQQAKRESATLEPPLPPIKFIVSIFPVTQVVNTSTRSYRAHRADLILSRAKVARYLPCYLFGREGCRDAVRRAQFLACNFTASPGVRARVAAALELTPDLAAFTSLPGETASSGDECDPRGDPELERTYLQKLIDPEVSPLFAESFEGMPPALIVTMGNDVLRDDGLAMVKRLREQRPGEKGPPHVGHLHYPSRFHRWFALRPHRLASDIRDYISKNQVL